MARRPRGLMQTQILKSETVQQTTPTEETQEELAIRLTNEIVSIVKNMDKNYLDLAENLFEVKVKELYRASGSANTFKEYCENVVGIPFSKGYSYTRIWDAVKSFNLPRERLEALGWHKAVILVKNYTEDGFEDLLEKAESMTEIEFTTYCSTRTGGHRVSGGIILKFLPDSQFVGIVMEAIELAKREWETDDATVACASLMGDWMVIHQASPEKVPIETFVSLLERNYGVKITVSDAEAMDEQDVEEEDPLANALRG